MTQIPDYINKWTIGGSTELFVTGVETARICRQTRWRTHLHGSVV